MMILKVLANSIRHSISTGIKGDLCIHFLFLRLLIFVSVLICSPSILSSVPLEQAPKASLCHLFFPNLH